MSHINIHREHSMTFDQAHEAAEALALRLADRYEVSHHWQDNSLYFERAGVSGQIDLEMNAIRINVRLSFLLAPLKPQLEQKIHEKLDETFGPLPDLA